VAGAVKLLTTPGAGSTADSSGPPTVSTHMLFCHYAYAIWLPDLGNMLLVGFASFEQAAGRVGCH
jgi:hypothetical protein